MAEGEMAVDESAEEEPLEVDLLSDGGVLSFPAFRLMLAQHFVGNVAFWAYFGTLIAQATFRFDASPRELAIIGACISVPFIFGALLQGFLVDRWSPKWLQFIGVGLIGVAIGVGWLATDLPGLYSSAFFIGMGAAAIEPARAALTALYVPERLLVPANAAITVVFQIAILSGTLLGGFLLAVSNASSVYVAAIALIAIAVVIAAFLPDTRQQGTIPELSFQDLGRGMHTAWRHPQIRLLLFVTGMGWMAFNAFFVLEPLYIENTLKQGDQAILYLWAAHGAGAICGALLITRLKRAHHRELALVGSGVAASGVGLLIYAGSGIYAVAFVGAAGIGAGLAFMFPPALSLIQRVVEEEERGRVSSVLLSLQEVMALLGSLLIIVLGMPDSAVQKVLVGVALAMMITGALGLRAYARLRRRGDD